MEDSFVKKSDDDFLFYVPVEIDKSEVKGWKIKGIASTPDKDDQNEIIVQKGLDISHLDKGLGLFNDDHGKGPTNVIGQITAAKKSESGLYVEGYLFKHQEKAKAYGNIMRSLEKGQEKRVKMSIEGKVLKRKGNKILRAKVMNVALTMNPINDNTYAQFAKSFAAQTEEITSKDTSPVSCESEVSSSASDSQVLIDKANLEILIDLAKAGLSTGNYNAPPGTLTGGAALATESLDKKKKKLKNKYKSKFKDILNMFFKSHPNITKEHKKYITKKIFNSIFKRS